jgi:predicted metal-binding transcription factor (methanogenesis marker protein 9)
MAICRCCKEQVVVLSLAGNIATRRSPTKYHALTKYDAANGHRQCYTSLWWCCKKDVMVLPDGVRMLPAVH